ncbi:TPA: DUF551 domain-containing protein [Salmonella enterica]|uniref:DUF551 domain-containing protein n=1 Tax=Salmonella TaxID=590 RepID=UPI002023D53F|nr:DUF551 domain-containing protein [Salmonella enterica]MCL9048793.1 DUF551 domain-containing protein [Salmonella enterica subsp. enterica serovar Enteritidis]EIV7420014.1 DUF551 domain-containing protein [Salmonella enterica]ELI2109139.1 DUF551 domain-containing protein [Salmonella enterica]MCL9057246.1 DUF551 domain-containing protein [Salmonella enterica subsp. enterica serovar Enteritidis]MCL9179922.1 DUF551 domain-containing protein [Salmonella enterica subsp. enterica serovar Enteritidi
MAELTKEWLKQTIAEYEANRDELPFGLDTNSAIELQAFKLALASLEAEPVAYIFKHPAGKLFWALTDESNKDQSDVIPVYAAPPVPVVPEEKPMPNPLKMYAVDAVAAIAEVRGWNACRAAMLQAEPVSQTYKSQHTQFEQVADLYEMQFDDGRTCAFHTDAQKAAQWLQACDGNRVQEYVKLERLQNALSGNSPVIPDGWISCSERMPDNDESKPIAIFTGKCLGQGMFVATYDDDGFFDYWEGMEIIGVTHWMPLPEPPQK